jgi:hypothetical protein
MGCEDWEREPGSDDEEGTWPPVAPYRAPIAPPDTRSARECELQQMIDQQKAAGWLPALGAESHPAVFQAEVGACAGHRLKERDMPERLFIAVTAHSEVPGTHLTLHTSRNGEEPSDKTIFDRFKANGCGKEDLDRLEVTHCVDLAHWLKVYPESIEALERFVKQGGIEVAKHEAAQFAAQLHDKAHPG